MQSRKMQIWLWAACAVLAIVGCRQPPEQAPVRSLRASGKTTFVCVGPDGRGRPLGDCPEGARLSSGGVSTANPSHELYALVTQTITAEVAVVRVTGGRGVAGVIDMERSSPGITPLRVGAKPVDIVSTPGGTASFVGVAEPGRAGIFGLATQCILPPRPETADEEAEATRDLTTWPACSLPTAPGEMQILVDPPDASGRLRETCGDEYTAELQEPISASYECGADLRQENGRPKLAVALPEWGQLAVFDAQEIMNRAPGSYEPCIPEAVVPLQNSLPEVVRQPLPADLVVEGCTEPLQEYGPVAAFESRPAGMAQRDGRLFVADRGGPLVHVLDVTSGCAPQELPPLVATSLLDPSRVVTTTKVAVSPVTSTGEQFVYAVDERGETTASVMIFDVTPGRASRTPLVREHSALVPDEPPDRLEFSAPAKDVAFAKHDLPVPDLVTGEIQMGIACDPDPDIDVDSPAARYRTTSDMARGARPSALRGVFGFVLLSNGRVAVVDVEDYDAACRRPTSTNTANVFDFRGCAGDDRAEPFLLNGVRTVSGETSCRAVVPHRARSARLVATTQQSGIGAPSLRALPRLTRYGRGLPLSNLLPQGQVNPLMAAVDFDNPVPGGEPVPAQTFVGVTLRTSGVGRDDLVLDPTLAEQASLALPQVDPRSYPTQETVTVTYEGPLAAERPAGVLEVDGATALLSDQDALFCELGVQDLELTREVGVERFGLEGAQLDEFAERHGDYVQITSRLRPSRDSYWRGAGATCGGGGGYELCSSVFGVGELDELDNEGELPAARDLRITAAYQDRLLLEPRPGGAAPELIACCFPDELSYRVRAGGQWVVRGSVSGFRHTVRAVATEDGLRCVRDCAPWRPQEQGRVFEISSSTEGCPALGAGEPDEPLPPGCAVGRAGEDDAICVYDAATGPVRPGGPASECIHDGLTARFVIYRGLEPSLRDMTYAYEVVGGFAPLAMPLTSNTNVILPVAITSVPGFEFLAVVDSQDRGLMLLSLRGVGLLTSFF